MEFVAREATRLACVRLVGSFAGMPQAFETLAAWAGPRGLLRPDTETMALYWDDPTTTRESDIRSDACLTVPEGVDGDGEVRVIELPAGAYAWARHVGPYDTLPDTYAALMHFVQERGRAFRDAPAMEIYLDGPDTPPEETRTDVYVAVE
jgi:AraC family transcriptional regulator